jgi:hypothetical protein
VSDVRLIGDNRDMGISNNAFKSQKFVKVCRGADLEACNYSRHIPKTTCQRRIYPSGNGEGTLSIGINLRRLFRLCLFSRYSMRLIDSRSFAAHQTIFVTAQAPEQPKNGSTGHPTGQVSTRSVMISCP